MFESFAYPTTYEDIQSWWEHSISEGETDADAFTFNDTKSGRSYKFYGQIVFQFKQRTKKSARLKLSAPVMRQLMPDGVYKDKQCYTVQSLTSDQVEQLLQILKEEKRSIFCTLANKSSHYPTTYEDVQTWWEQAISEGEADADTFTFEETKFGRSYKFYSQIVLQLKPGTKKVQSLSFPHPSFASCFQTANIKTLNSTPSSRWRTTKLNSCFKFSKKKSVRFFAHW